MHKFESNINNNSTDENIAKESFFFFGKYQKVSILKLYLCHIFGKPFLN